MEDSTFRQTHGGGELSCDCIDLICDRLDIVSVIRLAACSKQLYERIAYSLGTRWAVHQWDEPCLLMPDPDHWFDEHWHRDDENGQHHRLHHTMYDVVPLDHSRRTANLPFMCNTFWVGMNGDWLATVDERGNWCLANIYTEKVIRLPLSMTCGIRLRDNPSNLDSYSPMMWPHASDCPQLLKIVICQVSTIFGQFVDYKLIALFDCRLAYLEGGSHEWKLLENPSGCGSPCYSDAIMHGGTIFAVDGNDGSTYCWDPQYGNRKRTVWVDEGDRPSYVWDEKDGEWRTSTPFKTQEALLPLPSIIEPPLLNQRMNMWFLARSADCQRLMLIGIVDGQWNCVVNDPPHGQHSLNGLNLRQCPASPVNVFEQDPSFVGPPGMLVWRRVSNLSDHSLFLGLNYPINDNLKIRGCLSPDSTLTPFMRKNCVYTSYWHFRGTRQPYIVRRNLQPVEGELVGAIKIPKDGWDSVRQTAIWFKPSVDNIRLFRSDPAVSDVE